MEERRERDSCTVSIDRGRDIALRKNEGLQHYPQPAPAPGTAPARDGEGRCIRKLGQLSDS